MSSTTVVHGGLEMGRGGEGWRESEDKDEVEVR